MAMDKEQLYKRTDKPLEPFTSIAGLAIMSEVYARMLYTDYRVGHTLKQLLVNFSISFYV